MTTAAEFDIRVAVGQDMKRNTAIRKFTSMVNASQDRIEKFQLALAQDPAYAFSWGQSAFQSAATLKVAKQVVASLEGGATLKDIMESLKSHVLHSSKYPAQSTNPTSNLMEQYTLAAYAEAFSDIESLTF